MFPRSDIRDSQPRSRVGTKTQAIFARAHKISLQTICEALNYKLDGHNASHLPLRRCLQEGIANNNPGLEHHSLVPQSIELTSGALIVPERSNENRTSLDLGLTTFNPGVHCNISLPAISQTGETCSQQEHVPEHYAPDFVNPLWQDFSELSYGTLNPIWIEMERLTQ